MDRYLQIARDGYVGYARYLLRSVTEPSLHSWFYVLLGVSLAFWAWEIARPWRREQGVLRRDFWLDAFYMAWNFFLFSLIGWNAISNVAAKGAEDLLAASGIESLVAVDAAAWPWAAQLLLLFVVRDFVQYWIHRLLHRVPFFWKFHKVHHSVLEMGFAAHLRFHVLETVVYRTLEYVPMAMLGFSVTDFFVVHVVALVIGHWNHANVHVPLGPLRYLLNHPAMHIWHHARDIRDPHGVNFGLSLSVWDWLFGTAWIPGDGRDAPLGFDDVESFPQGFLGQLAYPFRRG